MEGDDWGVERIRGRGVNVASRTLTRAGKLPVTHFVFFSRGVFPLSAPCVCAPRGILPGRVFPDGTTRRHGLPRLLASWVGMAGHVVTVCTPATIKNLPSRSTAAPKTDGLACSAPSGHVAIASRAERSPKPSHSSLCAELPTSTTPAPPLLAPPQRKAALALTPGLAQDAEATGTHLPSLARGSAPRTQGPDAAADTAPTKAAPTRPTRASRRPMSKADTAAAAWLAAFTKWGLEN